MTKHPAQNTHTPPRAPGKAQRGSTAAQDESEPPTRKWLIVKGLAFWHTFTPDADRVVFYTWQEAMAYVNSEIRAEYWATRGEA